MLRKATFFMSAMSFATSVLTLAVVFKGVKKMNEDVEELRSKTNQQLGKFKAVFADFSV